jgi:hypothetical protein
MLLRVYAPQGDGGGAAAADYEQVSRELVIAACARHHMPESPQSHVHIY